MNIIRDTCRAHLAKHDRTKVEADVFLFAEHGSFQSKQSVSVLSLRSLIAKFSFADAEERYLSKWRFRYL